ncbi:MAG: phage tail sheath family protein [Candidatus Methanospirareceae archaeon]
MPEYLAPGVYIEEFEIGAKPIEGVSTSTAGFLGMAERGPLNKPTLVTSFAEYQRIFGSYLKEADYGKKRYLPYAVEGFFANGGQRVYVSRVAAGAAKSSCLLPDVSGGTTFLDEDVEAKAITLKVVDTTDLSENAVLFLKDGSQSEYVRFVSLAKALTLDLPLSQSHASGTTIARMDRSGTYHIAGDVAAGSVEIGLDTVVDIASDDVLIINDEHYEVCTIDSIVDNTVTVKSPLQYGHADAVVINKLASAATTGLSSAVKAEYAVIPIADDDTDFNVNNVIEIGGEYHLIEATDAERVILVAGELKHKHEKDETIKKLTPAFSVEASSEGAWGDRVKIVIKANSLSTAKLTADALDPNYLELDTLTGMEEGTLLKLPTTPPSYGTIKEVVKTDEIKQVVLKEAFTGSLSKNQEVSTDDFDLMVSFDGSDEAFKNLSMNESHSSYLEETVTSDASQLIRLEDLGTNGQQIPMPTQDNEQGWKLGGGNDGIPEEDDAEINTTYEGVDNSEPAKRKGIYTLKNIDDISIVSIPGIYTQHLQNKLIIHCETMKDRFAVLDSEEKADLDEIQTQRNFYDSKYAALYYPWIRVFDPLSGKRTNVPPSGYMCGIYARSDTERGVHKAPANEVVRGALGLEEFNGTKRIITKGQQDILNPKGVNCIRVFRGRGIRVWGARTISSDSLWKYVNVRRLFLFLEESIEDGTQWVVFEPNDQKLWARVRQTITQFLTRVWKDGALMGTTPEEAFFVKCDRTTMTQDDIDNGRLIVMIGVAPVKPAEFVIFRIAQWAGGSAATE